MLSKLMTLIKSTCQYFCNPNLSSLQHTGSLSFWFFFFFNLCMYTVQKYLLKKIKTLPQSTYQLLFPAVFFLFYNVFEKIIN